MANFNLTSQQIKDTYPQLAQVSASLGGSAVVDGLGVRVETLYVTASNAVTADNGGVTSIIAGTNVSIDQSTGDVTISATGGGAADTGSLLKNATNVDATITYTRGDGSTFQNIINNVANATVATTAVVANTAITANTASYVAGANVDGQVSSAASADLATTASYVAGGSVDGEVSSAANATSASHAITSDQLLGVAGTSYARVDLNNTFTGTQTFDNIAVNGTGSFAYIESVTGSAKIIGDAFIILNNDTPSERYAGIKVVDSGSVNNTSSFQYDGGTDDWFFEKDVLGSAEYGVALFGPEYTVKGTPTYNTANTIPKGTGGHHLNDSIITDDGSLVTVAGNLGGNVITANLFAGNLAGTASMATSASHALQADNADNADSATSASYVAGGSVDGTVASATSASYATTSSNSVNENTASGSLQFWQGSQTEYDLISGSALDNVIYFVVA